jgi:hypothetical protein
MPRPPLSSMTFSGCSSESRSLWHAAPIVRPQQLTTLPGDPDNGIRHVSVAQRPPHWAEAAAWQAVRRCWMK